MVGQISGRMNQLNKLVIIILSSFLLIGAARKKPAPEPAPLDRCRSLLLQQVEALPKTNSEWNSLPKILDNLQSATLLVKMNFGVGTPTLDYLQNLVKAAPGLNIPDALKIVYRDNLVVVANGDEAALRGFFDRVKKSSARDTTTFQVLDFASERSVFALPSRVIHIDENASIADQNEAERQIIELLNGKSGFSVHNIGEEQTVVFLPRQIVEDQARGRFFKAENIKTGWTRNPPELWTEWLMGKADDFEQPRVVYSQGWAILSPSAFRKVYELNRTIANALPDLGNVDINLTTALADCFGISCEVSPQQVQKIAEQVATEPEVEQDGALNWAARARIIKFLKAHRGRVRLSEKDALKKSFNELAVLVELLKDHKTAQKYKKDIADIGFLPTDYSMFASKNKIFETVHGRGRAGWRTFLRAIGSSYADRPVVARNISAAIDEIPADIRESVSR